jgi:tetratricopeptide (TPR) repeat protein
MINIDPLSFVPERFKEKLADGLVELLAGSAERLGGDQIASNIRKFSTRSDLLHSVDCALQAGIARFIEEYTAQDEDLVAAIRDDEIFWESEAVQDALVKLVSRPSAWLHEDRETVLRHFEAVLPRRVNRERVDKAVSFLLRCIAEELWSLPGAHEIREAYSIQFQELTAEAQLEQVMLARQQLQATTQLNADLRQVLLQLVELVAQKLLAAPPPVPLLPSPRPYHNLPQPTYTQFVGREEELAWLKQRLAPADRAWQIAITGIGGVGKSALALAVAHEYREHYDDLAPEERFEAIVWVSAKEEVLTAFGRERANVPEQVLHSLEDVYTAIARVLEREDITRAQPEEQNALVEKALKRQRVLLIMDNLESVKDDRIRAFLRNLPPPTKAVITSRESLDVADVRPLTGLPWKKAEELIAEECRVREVILTDQHRQRVFELTSGLPLPIKLGIARMASGESLALVERWLGDAVGELPEYCVKGQVELIRQRDPNALRALLATALFEREAGAAREALGYIADLSLLDQEKALAQLQRLFLVNRTDADRFWVLPIVQRFVSTELMHGLLAQDLVERWIRWLADFAMVHGTRADNDSVEMQRLAVEYPNLRTVIHWCRAHGKCERLLDLCEGTWPHPYRVAFFNELDEILNIWLAAAVGSKAEQSKGRAYLQMARLYWIWRQQERALECLDIAEPILGKHTDDAQLAEAWATRAQVHTEQGRLTSAEVLADQLLNLGRESGSVDALVLGAYRHAEVERKRGDFKVAYEWLDRAEQWAEEMGSERRYVSILFRKAGNLVEQGQYTEAERLLIRVLARNAEWGERRFIAYDKQLLARVYAGTERVRAAYQAAVEARDLFERMGMIKDMNQVDRLIRSLPSVPDQGSEQT